MIFTIFFLSDSSIYWYYFLFRKLFCKLTQFFGYGLIHRRQFVPELVGHPTFGRDLDDEDVGIFSKTSNRFHDRQDAVGDFRSGMKVVCPDQQDNDSG